MGIAGRVARMFLGSKLTPLIAMASLATGFIAMLATPREEEPQISVPMIDVFVQAPDLDSKEVENLAVRGLERRMWEIPGVEHVYSMAGDGQAMVTVRFKVGENQENSVTKVQAKLASSMDELPAGVSAPLVKAHSIDDVPVLALTLHSSRYGSDQLREIAVHLEDEIRTQPDVAQTQVIGGSPRQFRVILDPARLMANAVGPAEVAQAIRGSDARFVAGEFSQRDTVVNVRVGSRPATKEDLERLVVAVRPVAPWPWPTWPRWRTPGPRPRAWSASIPAKASRRRPPSRCPSGRAPTRRWSPRPRWSAWRPPASVWSPPT